MKSLGDISFYQADPLARLLLDRLHLTAMKAVLITLVVAFFIGIYVILFTNSISPDPVGILRNWVGWIWSFLLAPVLAGYYLWSSDTPRDIILSLESSDVVDISGSDIRIVSYPYQKTWRMILSIIGGLIVGALFYFTRSSAGVIASNSLFARVAFTIAMLVGGYMTTMLGLTLIMNVWMIWKILDNKKFRLRPLHPDQCGGLGKLSSYSLKTVYLAAAAGIAIGITEYRFITLGIAQEYSVIHLSIPLYLIWAISSFFAPLYTAHQGMTAARDEKLNDIAEKFRATYKDVGDKLTNGPDELEEGIGKIKQLGDYYEITKKFPIWPLNVSSLRKFFLSISAPFIPALVGLIIQVISDVIAR